jgi:predicted N-formylglutamate amidohydrolase
VSLVNNGKVEDSPHNQADGAESLLGPDDPPPFTRYNSDGSARVLIVADHSGRAFPRRLGQLGVADWVLDEHVAWDIGSADVAHYLSQRFDTPLICANYSRLVVDSNRRPDDPTSCIPVSAGIAIPGNLDLSEADRAARRAAIFDPYHDAVSEQLRRMRAQGYAPALISIHSCTPVFDQLVRPWHFGVLWDSDPRIAKPLLENLQALDGVCVGDNEPYSGRDPHDYTMDHHGEANRLPHVSVEVRQDLIDTPAGADRWAGLLAGALADILADDELYTYLG